MIAAAGLMPYGAAWAAENWSPHLPGVEQGMAVGALPPPGTYFMNTTLLAPYSGFDKNGDRNGLVADVFVDVPALLWNPGIKVLGADYAAAIAQPFTKVKTAINDSTATDTWGLFSTIVSPGMLSWSLPNNFHVKTGVAVYLPTGKDQRQQSTSDGTYAGVANSIGYWAVEPSLSISWLHDGWNIGASINYDYNFKNTNTGYTSGDMIVVDYTLTKTIDAWTVGLGGYSVNQIQDDKSTLANIQQDIDAKDGNRQSKYGVGPLVGYDFGPFALTGVYNHTVGSSKNTVNGDSFWTRLSFPF